MFNLHPKIICRDSAIVLLFTSLGMFGHGALTKVTGTDWTSAESGAALLFVMLIFQTVAFMVVGLLSRPPRVKHICAVAILVWLVTISVLNVGHGLAPKVWLLIAFPVSLSAILGAGVSVPFSRIFGNRPTAVDTRSRFHDAFISYSRKDLFFAQALQEALNGYKPPKDLKVPQRYLNVFYDVSDFSGVDYYQSIEEELMKSKKLIVICSPNARRSAYVNDEISRFVKGNSSKENIIPILISGIPNNEAKYTQEEEKAFPEVLYEAMDHPLAIDYRNCTRKDKINKGIFVNAWYTILSNLYEVERRVIEQRTKKRQAEIRRNKVIVAGVTLFVLSILFATTLFYNMEAQQRGEKNFQLRYVNDLNLAGQEFEQGNYYKSRQLLSAFIPPKTEIDQEDIRDFYWYYLWHLNHGANATLTHPDEVWSITYSPDGRLLASGSHDNTIRLWDTERRELLVTLKGHTKMVTSVAFSPDGRMLASGSWDNTVKLWDTEKRELLVTLKGHTKMVTSVAFSPGGRLLASGSYDDTVRLWDTEKRELFVTLKGHRDSVSSVAFSPDGRLLASSAVEGNDSSVVKIWDTVTFTLLTTFNGQGALAFSPDGNVLAIGRYDIMLWDIEKRRLLATMQGYDGEVIDSMAFSRDGRFLASGDQDTTVKIWDVESRQLFTTFAGHELFVMSVAFSPDGQFIASASLDNTVKLWDLTSVSALEGHTEAVQSVAFSPNGQLLASGGRDKTVKLWDVSTQQLLASLTGHNEAISSVDFSTNGRLLASGSRDKTVKLWDVSTQQLLASLAGHNEAISSVEFSPDGRLLASGSLDKTVKLWDVSTQQLLASLAGHNEAISSVEFSPDGRLLASGSWDNTVKLWDIKRRKEFTTLGPSRVKFGSVVYEDEPSTDNGSELLSRVLMRGLRSNGIIFYAPDIAFSPNGQFIASVSWVDNSDSAVINIWDVRRQKIHTTLEDRAGLNYSVAFSPDGRLLAIGSGVTINLWDVKSWQQIGALKNHKRNIYSVAFSPNGWLLASGGLDNTVKIWRGKTERKEVHSGRSGVAH